MVPQYIADYLVSHNFKPVTDGYRIEISNQTAGHITYYNCYILVGTWATNYFMVEIFGYDERDNKVKEITRNIHPGVGMFVERYYTNDIISGLAGKAVAWSL